MTQAAKLKSVIRARAARTGESYTAARRHVLALKATEAGPKAVVTAKAKAAKPSPRVPRGELSDKTARKSTGHGLDYWFDILDRFGKEKGHTRAAEFLYTEHKVPAWHGQMITVTWERRRGLRQENQSCTGTFQVSVSRTLPASISWVIGLLNDAKRRRAWLEGASPALGKAMEQAYASGKSMELKKPDTARLRYKWLSSVVELRAYAKGADKTSLVADSSALPNADAVGVRRDAFAEALDQLRDLAERESVKKA